MTEELRVKLVLDDSGVTPALNKFKQNIEKTTASISKGTKGASAATSSITNTVEELRDSIDQIRNLQFADMLVQQLDKIKVHLDNVKDYTKLTFSYLGDSFKNFKGFAHFSRLAKQSGQTYREAFAKVLKDKSWKDFKTSLEGAKQGFAELGAAGKAALSAIHIKLIAVVAALAALVASIKNAFSTAKRVKELSSAAQKIGLSVSAYQEWAYVLDQVGVGADKLTDFIKTLTEEQLAVREGSEDMTNSFKRLGLAQEEVINMSQEELFTETVKRLQNVKNETERTSLAYQIFGEDAAELANVLRLTNSETASLANNVYMLGAATSDALINKSKALSAAVSNLKLAWQGLTNTLAEIVMPVVTKVVEWLTRAILVVNLFIKTLFGLDLTGSTQAALSGAVGGVSSYTDSVEEATGAVEKLKRVTMGFDELNVVQNPNASAGSGSGAGGAGGGFSIPDMSAGSDQIADNLGLSKIHEWFEKWKNVIQDMVTWGTIGAGIGIAVYGALTGNLPLVLKGLALAGVGFALGSVEGSTFDRLRQTFEENNLAMVPLAMIGVGAAGMVLCALMFNWPGVIAFAALAGVGVATVGGFSGLSDYIKRYSDEVQKVVAPSMIGIGAALALVGALTANIPLLGAGVALAGIGLSMGAMANENGLSGYVNEFKTQIGIATGIALSAVGIIGCIICLLTGNIPGAVMFGAGAIAGLVTLGVSTGFFSKCAEEIKKVWQGLKEWFNTTVKPVFTKDYWAQKWEHIRTAAREKLEAVRTTISEKWNAVKNWWTSGPGKVFTKEYWANKFEAIRSGINTKLGETRTAIINGWNNIKSYWSTNIAPKFTKEYWANKFETFRAAINEKIGAARTAIMNGWNNIKSYWSTNIAPKFTKQYWLNVFETVRAGASEKMNAAKTTIQNAWNNIKSWFNTNVKPKFTVSYWSGKFNTIKDGAKSSFNGIISIVERAINSIINKINTLKWKVPDWVPGIGGKSWGFNFKTVSIPRLATGGIATRSVLANIGENGREAVLPLDNNTGWMDKLADRIASRNGTPTKIVLKVGERELGWASINGINQITKQTGELQLVL